MFNLKHEIIINLKLIVPYWVNIKVEFKNRINNICSDTILFLLLLLIILIKKNIFFYFYNFLLII